jgi:preprotein translocase subunit SecA
MNDQRNVVYSQRKDILETKNPYNFFLEILEGTIENILEIIISEKKDNDSNKEEIKKEFKNSLGLLINNISSNESSSIKKEVFNHIKNILEKKIIIVGSDNFNLIIRQLSVQVLDQQWKQHLLSLDNLRQGIGLRAYAQRDPLNEYKREAFTMFEEMLSSVRVMISRLVILIEFRSESSIDKKKSSNYRERLRNK